jgi:dTDP-4-dehydrorhamnose 3,5-epimerase
MTITVTPTTIPDVLIVEPKIFEDERGYFFESFNSKSLQASTNTCHKFVQDNHSKSSKGVLRGLHYQIHRPQGKLVRVIEGTIFDVAVDIRVNSPTFGMWAGVELSADNRKQLWVPPDFAHGFYVKTDCAQVLYKTTEFFYPENERTILWNDKNIGIDWPLTSSDIILSEKDKAGELLSKADLPVFSK